MSYENNQPSLAIQAHCCQNLYEPSAKYPEATPDKTAFPGHDTFQNGVIVNGRPTTFYTAATNADIENIKNKNSNMSGFLSDEATINSCKNDKGILDANLYADKTQTQPWRPSDAPPGADYTYRENIAAFNVNWDALNDPKNADLKGRLCDEQGNLKCAFGKAEENTHWGTGGGNQYYFNKADFNEAVNSGIFEYDDNKTLKESDGTLNRRGISEDEYDVMDFNRKKSIDQQLSSCQDKNATTDIEKAKSLNEITLEKANQINTAQVASGDYLAKPDPAYYGIKSSSEESCGASISDIGTITAPQSATGTPAGPSNVDQISSSDNSKLLNNLAEGQDKAASLAEGSANTAKNMSGGLMNG